MKKIMSLLTLVAVLAVTTNVNAEGKVPPAPAAKGARLFQCVKIEDRDNIHPCAVVKIVSIVDPCWKPDPCACKCQKAPCVLVKICVPPCGCPKVKVSRKGRKVEYDYGDYEVEITSKNGVIKVNYDD